MSNPANSSCVDLSGLWVPLVTPFDTNGAIDHAALARLAKRLATAGVTGTVVCGSTGEAAALDEGEQLAALETVAVAAPALPRIVGLSGYHLGQTLAWVQRLNREAPTALLVPAPHYIRPSQQGLIDWFTSIAEASGATGAGAGRAQGVRASEPCRNLSAQGRGTGKPADGHRLQG